MSINNIFVLGGGGFLGSNLVHKLSKLDNIKVSYGCINKNSFLEANYQYIDILDLSSMKILNDYDCIINCTGQTTYPFNLCYKLNTIGVSNIISSIRESQNKLFHISTVSVYGSANFCDESSALNPETNYSTSKAIAEFYLKKNIDKNRLSILRLSNLYGQNQQKGIVAYILKSYFSDRKLHFNNDGSLVRHFLNISDCAEIIIKMISKSIEPNTYNIKGNETFTIKSLVELFEQKFDVLFDKHFEKSEPWENIDILDNTRLNLLMNYNLKHNLFEYFEKELYKN